jgi:hypothetical protein
MVKRKNARVTVTGNKTGKRSADLALKLKQDIYFLFFSFSSLVIANMRLHFVHNLRQYVFKLYRHVLVFFSFPNATFFSPSVFLGRGQNMEGKATNRPWGGAGQQN